MSLSTGNLSPYAAFLLYEYPAGAVSKKARGNRLKTLSEAVIASLDPATTTVAEDSAPRMNDALVARVLWLERQSEPSWSNGAGALDISQHLVVMIEYEGKLGIAVSDSKLRREVETVVNAQPELSALSANRLENALLRSRTLRTLWLRGSHRKSALKADSKVLSGPSLGTALNPLDDRTFSATSARASTDLPPVKRLPTIGVNPDRSYVWIGPCEDWASFTARFRDLVDYIGARAAASRPPLPILSQTLSASPAAGSVREAFDFTFISVETAFGLEEETEAALQTAQDQLTIQTVATRGQNFSLAITDRDQPNAEANTAGAWYVDAVVALDTGKAVATPRANSTNWSRWATFKELLRDKSLWSVWYESGHSLSNGRWTMLDARASSFDGKITEVDFLGGSWHIDQEKPLQGKKVLWDQIGSDKSLFSWWIEAGMQACFPDFATNPPDPSGFAYVICDDGSSEMGDFIVFAKHLSFAQASTNPSELAFIMVHMKAASDSGARQMAPKRYEEVLGQATKNLGRAGFPDAKDHMITAAGKKQVPVWKWDGHKFELALQKGQALPASDQMRTDLAQFDGRRVHLHVVVVQPHQVVGAFKTAMQAPSADFKTRMLCTLLCAADGAARAASAKFQVVMSA